MEGFESQVEGVWARWRDIGQWRLWDAQMMGYWPVGKRVWIGVRWTGYGTVILKGRGQSGKGVWDSQEAGRLKGYGTVR